jgi:CHAT domain-containing protein/tetratricopeptide (TPR) repeat protein
MSGNHRDLSMTQCVMASLLAVYLLSGCSGTGRPAERTILDASARATGKSPVPYSVEAFEGEWIHVVLKQDGLDLEVRVTDPNGARIGTFESFTGRYGEDRALIEVQTAGRYSVSVASTKSPNITGAYRLVVLGLESPSPAIKRFALASARSEPLSIGQRIEHFVAAASEFRRDSQYREEGLALLAALYLTNETASNASRAVEFGSRAVEALRATDDPKLLASALSFFAVALGESLESARMTEVFGEARAIFATNKLAIGLAEADLFEGVLKYNGENEPELLKSLLTIASRCEALSELDCQALSSSAAAILLRDRGDYESAFGLLYGAIDLIDPETDSVTYSQVADNLAFTLRMVGDFDEAITFHREATAAYSRFGECSGISRSLYGLGFSLLGIGDTEQAMRFYELALRRVCSGASGDSTEHRVDRDRPSVRKLCEIAAMPRARDEHDLVIALWAAWDLGNHARSTFDADTALYCHQVASTFASIEKYRLGTGLERVRDLLDLERTREAQTLFEEIQSHVDDAGAWYQAQAADVGALLLAKQRAFDAAFVRFKEASEKSKKVDNHEAVFASLAKRASLASSVGDRRANLYFTEADAALEQVRLLSLDPTFSASLFASGRQMYEDWIEISLDRSRPEEVTQGVLASLVTSERSRARLLSQLTKSYHIGAEARAARQRPVASMIASLLESVEAGKLGEGLAVANQAGRRGATGMPGVGSEVFDKAARDQLAQKIRQFQHSLPPGTAAIEYFLGVTRSHAWIVQRDEIRRVEIASAGVIEKIAGSVESALDSAELTATGKAALARAYDSILRPVLLEVEAENFMVIPDGALREIPFAALWDSERGEYFVERATVAYLPSIDFVVSRQMNPGHGVATQSALLVGDPVYDEEDLRRRCGVSPADVRAIRVGDSERVLPRLPASSREVRAIAAVLQARKVTTTLLAGCDAARDRVLQSGLANYRFIHFATHATADRVVPQRSAIHLSSFGLSGRRTPGEITASDFLVHLTNADLVVLSGCTTAGGRQFSGEGSLGLSFSMLAGGSRRVISTMWPVADAASALMMSHMYEALIVQEQQPSLALRSAQLAMLSTRPWSHPRHWAAYSLYGS